MNFSYTDALKKALPEFGPFIEQQFADQSEAGVSRGIKRFVNSLSPKKLFQAANDIDEWRRAHIDDNPVQIILMLREGLRVKISLQGLFILSKHPGLDKMNRYALKEAIGNGRKKNFIQVANQIKQHPKYLGKVSKILKKLKRERPEIAREFCYTLTLEVAKEDKAHETAIKILSDFNDMETSKKLHEYFSAKSLITKASHPLKEKLEELYPEWITKEKVKKEEKRASHVDIVFIVTIALSLVGFALSFLLGSFILLCGSAFAFYIR